MADAAAVGLIAAVLQLLKYAHGVYKEVASLGSASSSLQFWENRTRAISNLIQELELDSSPSDVLICELLHSCKEQTHLLWGAIQELSEIGGGNRISRVCKAMRIVAKDEDIAQKLARVGYLLEDVQRLVTL
jgi:hypothetical protein